MSGREELRRSPRRDEAKAGTRRRVLAAAMEVFAREGYHAARMDAIAEATGVSKGGLYFHFPGKFELVSALVDEFATELAADAAASRRCHVTTSTRRSPRPASRRSTPAWPPTRGSARSTKSSCSSLQGELPAPAEAAPALSALLLRSVGAADTGAAADR